VAQALLGTRSVSGTLGCWNPYFFPLEALTDIGASLGATERDEWLRAAWRVMVAGEAETDAERLVFVYEMGSNTSLAPLHAWLRRGERATLRCAVGHAK
jgi:hypothetical protein